MGDTNTAKPKTDFTGNRKPDCSIEFEMIAH